MGKDISLPPDLRNDETKRATSHLNSFRLPEEAESAAEEKLGEEKEVELPSDAAKVHALLKEALELPAGSKSERIVKQNRVARISAHLHAIGQGTPAPVITLKSNGDVRSVQNELAEAMQIETLGRQFPIVKKLADKFESVKKDVKQIETLTAELAALKKQIETLTAELAEALKSQTQTTETNEQS